MARTLLRNGSRRIAAAAAGTAALASTASGVVLSTPLPAGAAAAPGQDVLNDWGQSSAEISQEIAVIVDADTRVIAARTRYLNALSSYASLKQVQRVARTAYSTALATRTKTDDPVAYKRLTAINTKVFVAAREVAASQLAMVKIVDSVTSAVKATHYVQAPYVAKPAQPTGLATVGASGQVTLSWNAIENATSYHVYRDGQMIGTTVSPGYVDSGLDNGSAYAYTVVALNVAGWSPISAEVVGVPTAVAPSAPFDVVAAPGDGSVHLAWTAVPSATSYQVFRNGTLVGSPTAPDFVDSGLTNGTSYSYTVKALNGATASVASSAVPATPVATAPAAPTNLVATPGNATVGLSWTAPAGATSYAVYRGGVVVATTATPTWTDTTVSNGTTYSYYVVAYKQNSPASAASATVTAKPVAPPLSTPTGLAATPGDATVALTWSSVAGATGYDVYRGGVKLTSVATPAYTDNTVSNGTTYSYYVIATSATSSSAQSATVSATPAAPAPGAPTGLSGVAGDQTATLTWNVVTGATSYNLYRNGTLLKTGITGNTYTDSALTNGTAYTYQVTVIKTGVESAKSASVQVTPFVITPTAPTGLMATAGDAQVALSWSPTANAQGYKLYRGATLIATLVSPTTSFVDSTGLTNGTAYSYTVYATNGSATSPASAAVTATPMAPAPGQPTNLVATPGNAQVVLTWNAVATATSYKVYRGGVLLTTVTSPTYTNTGLTNGTAYTYYVTAVAATTEGVASASVTATPAKPPVNGTFTGNITSIASGHGTIQVVIVVTNSVITSSKGTLLTNDGSETVKINSTALPQYDTKAVAAQSANITKVSGASLTWTAYKTSLQSALTKAGL
ncbi:MAG: hypothetical protein U0R68_15440 [Candidatus Nanopelagicales bacterium]